MWHFVSTEANPYKVCNDFDLHFFVNQDSLLNMMDLREAKGLLKKTQNLQLNPIEMVFWQSLLRLHEKHQRERCMPTIKYFS